MCAFSTSVELGTPRTRDSADTYHHISNGGPRMVSGCFKHQMAWLPCRKVVAMITVGHHRRSCGQGYVPRKGCAKVNDDDDSSSADEAENSSMTCCGSHGICRWAHLELIRRDDLKRQESKWQFELPGSISDRYNVTVPSSGIILCKTAKLG